MTKNFYFAIVFSFLAVESFNCQTIRLQLPAGTPLNERLANMCTTMEIESNETLVVERIMAYDDSTSASNAPEIQRLFACSHNPFKGVNIPKSAEQTTWKCPDDAFVTLFKTCKTVLPSPEPMNGLNRREVGYGVGGSTGLGLLIMVTHFHKHNPKGIATKNFATPNAGMQFSLRPFSEVPNHVIDPQMLLIVLIGDEIPPFTRVQVEHAYLVESSDPMHVFAFVPHTHMIGVEEHLSIRKKDGREIRRATFGDPTSPYYRSRFVTIPDFEIEQGDQVIVSCKYENNSTMAMSMGINDEVCTGALVYSTDSPRLVNVMLHGSRAKTTVLGHIN